MPTPTVDWTIEPIRIFRAYARHDYEAMRENAEAHGTPFIHALDQAVAALTEQLTEAGIDLREPAALYYFILGAHAQWGHAVGFTVVSCENPAMCGQAFMVHSANASVGFRVAMRELLKNVPGLPPEPEADTPPEYVL